MDLEVKSEVWIRETQIWEYHQIQSTVQQNYNVILITYVILKLK